MLLAVLLVLVASAAFYWYDLRPRFVRVGCAKYVNSLSPQRVENVQPRYDLCLREHGLEP